MTAGRTRALGATAVLAASLACGKPEVSSTSGSDPLDSEQSAAAGDDPGEPTAEPPESGADVDAGHSQLSDLVFDFVEESDPAPDATDEPEGPSEGPSCEGLNSQSCSGGSCCGASTVPTSEVLVVGTPEREGQISSFVLDKFEVTVGRFRRFVDAYPDWRPGNPAPGAGANPVVDGSGWQTTPEWERELAGSQAVLRVNIRCDDELQSWTDEPGPGDNLPMNCVSWFEAFAFCIWDGGRLPTELEWEYAASAGGHARRYPWADTPLDPTFAVYGCLGAGEDSCSKDDQLPVGSRPNGDGRYGQSDLAGSVREWVLDWSAPFPEILPTDYAKVDEGTRRMSRGGGWFDKDLSYLETGSRQPPQLPTFRRHDTGIRCARDLPASQPR